MKNFTNTVIAAPSHSSQQFRDNCFYSKNHAETVRLWTASIESIM